MDEKGQLIGVGKVSYDDKRTIEIMGKKGYKPVIHYDYLYLE
jgi:glutamate 5-kinase